MKDHTEAAMVQEMAERHELPPPIGRATVREPNDVKVFALNHDHALETELEPSHALIPDRIELDQAISNMREAFTQVDAHLKIEVDADLRRIVVKVVNAQSGEVIRQIPALEILEIAKRLDASQGLLFTTRT